jgi:1-acyl-sn-glycerol-3-phosphate acyltransferase
MIVTFKRDLPLIMARTIWSPGILWSAGVKLEIYGKDLVESGNSTPAIVVSNHSSFLDIPIMCRVIPLNLHFTAKSQIKRMPLFGLYMMATGMIFIDRSNRKKAIQSINKASELIRKGKNVLIYPEGKRSITGVAGPFKKGAFHLAIKSGADVIPVAIEGADTIWPKSSLKLFPGKVKVQIGARIPSNAYTEATVQSLADKARDAVTAFLPEPSLHS